MFMSIMIISPATRIRIEVIFLVKDGGMCIKLRNRGSKVKLDTCRHLRICLLHSCNGLSYIKEIVLRVLYTDYQ